MPDHDTAHIPRCTYRLQLQAGFGFAEAATLADYLAELGVSHCYTAPFFKARPGSGHGYDMVDFNRFNLEIGDEADFRSFVGRLAEHGLALLIDVVPNHMGVMGSDNRWWLDVLENGPASTYASFFDIDWQPLKKSLRHRLLVPVLGDHYGRELEAGRIGLFFDEAGGSFAVRYFDHLFPLDPRTYPIILRRNLKALSEKIGEAHPDLLALDHILELCARLPGRRATSSAKMQQRRLEGKVIKEELAALAGASPHFHALLLETVRQLNGIAGEGPSFAELHHLLERQVFRLSYWKVAAEEINYRRFFDINDLAGLRVEHRQVFEETHRLLFRLVAEGAVAGLRIDHIDGLYNPLDYLRRLRRRLRPLLAGRPLYLVAEKILAFGERLPADWPVHGTTGYDFGALLGALLLDGEGLRQADFTYRRLTGVREDFKTILRESKKWILLHSLSGELNMLASRLDRLSERNWRSRDFTLYSLRRALVELISCFPVYRTYVAARKIGDADRQAVQAAVGAAKAQSPGADPGIFDFIETLLLQEPSPAPRRSERRAVLDFAMRFQQLTAPVTAKGMEDTAFYRYHRLLALNEVGGDPGRFSLPVEDFHRMNRERLENWPHTMLATSTHDSKRGEDVRARLAVLSEAPGDWRQAVLRWRRFNRGLKRRLADRPPVPDANDEYFLYQNLFGFWPLAEPDNEDWLRLRDRLAAYVLKAAREAKLHTSWRNPDTDYEAALDAFVKGLFAERDTPFWQDFFALHRRLAPFGLYNGLSQLLLKLTAPGVPDIYQGCELWSFSLVDPDNRRPVDFEHRRLMLRGLSALMPSGASLVAELEAMMRDINDGRLKMYITLRCLALRRQLPLLFAAADYLPLVVQGSRAAHVCAFLRRRRGRAMVVLAPRLYYRLCGGDPAVAPLGGIWGDTAVALPEGLAETVFVCQFSGEDMRPEKAGPGPLLPLGRILRTVPVALLVGRGR